MRAKLNLKFCISFRIKKCVNISDLARAVDLINMNKKSSNLKSMLICVSCVPAYQRGLCVNVFTCQHGLFVNVPKLSQLLITYQHVNKYDIVSDGMLMFQFDLPTCQTKYQLFNLVCQLAKTCGNFSDIPLTKCKGKFLYFAII